MVIRAPLRPDELGLDEDIEAIPSARHPQAREAPTSTFPPPSVEEPDQTEAEEEAPLEPEANVWLTAAATFLATAAAGWMAGGIFRGVGGRLVGMLGAWIGVGIIALSYRTRRPALVQYLVFPAAVLVGALLVVPDARGGSANLPGLVAEALRTGGIAQPPIAFDPGWRFLLVVLLAFAGAAACSLAIGLHRPKLGIFVPVPLLFVAALVQPASGTLLSSGVALVLIVASLAVSYGVELARDGATSGNFEARRLARGAGIVVLLVAVVVALAQAGFLFPEQARSQVIPPKRPESRPPISDRLLFTVTSQRPGPWRLGVLDVYERNAWLTPPFDSARLRTVPASGVVPRSPSSAARSTQTIRAQFIIKDVQGHVVPAIANYQDVDRRGFALQFDPRTQELRLPERRAFLNMSYTLEAPTPPDAQALAKAPRAPPSMREFLTAPTPPSEVTAILAEAPRSPLFDRLQFVRSEFYKKVVAAGSGRPVDVPPSRVGAMLRGEEASPYEITAAEALLARWAGVPSRIGYGYFAGKRKGQTYEVHPQHGSTWLEAYFHGYGWLPIIGVPPQAKASLSKQQKNPDPEIRPTKELALVVYVPVRLRSITLLYTLVRYWVAVSLPFVAGLLLLYAFGPGVFKLLRRYRRRNWAEDRTPLEQIVVAYAEFRDAAADLGVGSHMATPIEFVRAVEPDDEHAELAWLVTRAVWGDLRRDLRPEDAEAAEEMAGSVTRRLRRAHPASTRFLTFGTRASLRRPYTREIPNLWPQPQLRARVRRALRSLGRHRVVRRLLPAGATMLIIALLMASCTNDPFRPTASPYALPARIVPDGGFGEIKFQREPKAERAYREAGPQALVGVGRVYTIRIKESVEGSLQVAAFKRGLSARDLEVRRGVLEGIGTGNFRRRTIGAPGEAFDVYHQALPEQDLYVWFPQGRYYELVVARKTFASADELPLLLMGYQRAGAGA